MKKIKTVLILQINKYIILITPFRIEDAQSNGSNPVISAPERGILNEKWCKMERTSYTYISSKTSEYSIILLYICLITFSMSF